ncbi:endonuclease/exonuclease/phosphatase family protein [Microcoleus sp. FACHB-53]|nr:endonuclease/exonuclease/phosphatase family protein [Microcoleus sp. FACHB-53]
MEIRVMSFNLRYDKPDPGDHAWKVRKQAVAALITHYSPDIIGTQEGQAHQLLDLHRLLPDYQSVGSDRTGTDTGEYCAIFYRTERLRCLRMQDFVLSDTPEIPGSISPAWGNPIPRMASWAEFAVAGEARTITLLNTHLDYKSVQARELGVKLIRDRLCRCAERNRIRRSELAESYLFLTGDFNADPGTVPREMLKSPLSNGVTLHDALTGIELEHQLSFHDFTGKASAAIDTIYYDSRISLQNVCIDAEQWLGLWPSDHFPVVANFVSTELNPDIQRNNKD